MQAIASADDAASPASKRAGLRSQRGPDSKGVLIKCNGVVSKVSNSEEEPLGRPLQPGDDDDEDDDDGYWPLLLHAKCRARFYTAPHPHGATTEGSTSLWPGWPLVRMALGFRLAPVRCGSGYSALRAHATRAGPSALGPLPNPTAPAPHPVPASG
eukprot:scaffold21977_cov53-Phaeocystis_antarctica.AAC.1